MMRMNRQEFEKVVARALDGLPPEIAERLENVAVVVEEELSDEEIEEVGLDPETDTLFGLYQGLARSATWKGKSLPPASWRRACETNYWMRGLFGRTCEPSTAGHGVESWISSLAASRASPSAPWSLVT
jgi:hypothetical protein